MESSDLALIQGLKAKDESAFELMYEKFFPKVFNHVFRELKNQGKAEEVTASVFFDLIDSLDELTCDTTLTGRIYRLTRHHLASRIPVQRKLNIQLQARVHEGSAAYHSVKEAISNACVQK